MEGTEFPLLSFFFHLFAFSSLSSFPFFFPSFKFLGGGAIVHHNLGGACASFAPPPPEYAPGDIYSGMGILKKY